MLVRSNSLTNIDDHRPLPRRSHRARHQTLAYGVSPTDLNMASRGGSNSYHHQQHNDFDCGAPCPGGPVGMVTNRRSSVVGSGFDGHDCAAEWRNAHQVSVNGNSSSYSSNSNNFTNFIDKKRPTGLSYMDVSSIRIASIRK